MRVVNTDSASHQSKIPENYLETSEKENKNKYLDNCLDQHQNFAPFLAPQDGLLGVEVEATIKCIASHLPKNWKKPYSRTYEYVKSTVMITLVQAMHRCIRGERVTS